MGSGGSKPKNVTKSGSNVSGAGKTSKNDDKLVKEKQKREESRAQTLNSHQNNNTKVTESAYSNNKKGSRTYPQQSKKDLGKFESDSDSEGEDINAVLAATKRQVEEQNYLNANKPQEDYPETYAQRLQREQYKQQPPGLIRQKTIYRNPDEWDVDDRDSSFDVSKFKQANVMKTQHQSQLDNRIKKDTDIFSPNPTERHDAVDTRVEDHRANMFYTQPQKSRESLPHYDTSEEALLAEIEQEF